MTLSHFDCSGMPTVKEVALPVPGDRFWLEMAGVICGSDNQALRLLVDGNLSVPQSPTVWAWLLGEVGSEPRHTLVGR